MAWPLRMYEASEIYFVTARCFQGRLLLRPSRETNAVLGGVLARAARLAGVEIFAFVFASNHLHLLVRAPGGNLPRFMQYLLANVSRKVGWLVGWRGAFWERRYSAEPVLDDEALFGRVRYILAHGVKEGLVRKCGDWPGLSCLRQMVGARLRQFRWFDWTRRWRARTRREARDRMNELWTETETLTLTPLPFWAHMTESARRRQVLRAVTAIERDGASAFERVLGRRRVLSQDPQVRPNRPARLPRPRCHASRRELRAEFAESYRAFTSVFLHASEKWRRGDLSAAFPPGAFRPVIWPSVLVRPLLAVPTAPDSPGG
jgi:REP element-mobilizing transposase RayT